MGSVPDNVLGQPQSIRARLHPPIPLAGTPEEDVLVAELLPQELGEGLQAGRITQQLVEVGRPSTHPPDVLLRALLLTGGMLDDGLLREKKGWLQLSS